MMKKRLHVLHIFSKLGIGGAEIWLLELLRYYKAQKNLLSYDIEVDILITSGEKSVFDAEICELSKNLYYLKYSKKNILRFIYSYRSILSKNKYDVIHDHQDYTSGYHFFFGIFYLPKIRVVHIHNPWLHQESYQTSFLRKITAFIGKYFVMNFATHILGTSDLVIDQYGFKKSKNNNLILKVTHCGFDTNKFLCDHNICHKEICRELGLNTNIKFLLFIGRLDSNLNQKNPEFAIKILKKCLEIDSNIRLLIVGSGNLIINEKQIDHTRLILEKKIFLLGARFDIPKLMNASHLLLFPSIAEGLGMVTIEAQAAGLRVLASDSVPNECKYINNIVSFKSLEENEKNWAEFIIDQINLPRPNIHKCNEIIKQSPFSIIKSAENLQMIYMN